ncbi:MAG: hypothetical protein GY853_11790 [PVC group bacterium]|nr:hypothetical protein [PVC group bacterium]
MLKTVIYITKQKLRLAQYNVTKESCKLLKDKSILLKGGDFDLAEVKTIIQKEGLAKGVCLSCLLRHEVGVRFYAFPSRQEQEIARMVDYEAAELLPLKPEETITRYLILNTRQDGYSDTMVMVTHKDEVLKRISKFQATGLEINMLSLSSLAIFTCVQKMILHKRKDALKGNLLVVYCEDGAVEVSIIKNKKLIFNRGFIIEDANNFSKSLISEIRHSIGLFSGDIEKEGFERIILSGRNVDLDEVKKILQDKFDVPLFIEDKIDIAYGLVLGGRSQVNLLSNEFISARVMQKLKDKFLAALLLLILNIALLGGIFIIRLHNKEAYLNNLKEKLVKLKPQAEELQNKLAKIEMVKMQLNSQILILNAIADIVKVTSSACTLNTLSINEFGVLVIRGQTQNLQEVLDFVVELEKSPYFKESHLNYSSRRKVKDKEILDFEINANLLKESPPH